MLKREIQYFCIFVIVITTANKIIDLIKSFNNMLTNQIKQQKQLV